MTVAELKAYLENTESLDPIQEEVLEEDRRLGVAALLRRYRKKKDALLQEEARLQGMLAEEIKLAKAGIKLIAGVDEAGRGPLAGPVVAAAVILPPGKTIRNLRDSKQLPAATREAVFEEIVTSAVTYGLGSASRDEIDSINIHAASMLAMKRALKKLSPGPEFVLVDGFPIKNISCRQKAIKGGDNLSLSIAAASVLAKVSRDRIMLELHRKYPRYGFDRNAGYGTAEHRAALMRYGPCPQHRQSFRLTPT